jgi:death-on-curing protein
MIFIEIDEVLRLQARLIDQSGGSHGILNRGAVESALAQPRMTFGGAELYPTLVEKAVALGFSLIQNHAFVDGNKRIGQAAMELFLVVNGFEIQATVEEQEQIILQVASGLMKRDTFTQWVAGRLIPCNIEPPQ